MYMQRKETVGKKKERNASRLTTFIQFVFTGKSGRSCGYFPLADSLHSPSYQNFVSFLKARVTDLFNPVPELWLSEINKLINKQ